MCAYVRKYANVFAYTYARFLRTWNARKLIWRSFKAHRFLWLFLILVVSHGPWVWTILQIHWFRLASDLRSGFTQRSCVGYGVALVLRLRRFNACHHHHCQAPNSAVYWWGLELTMSVGRLVRLTLKITLISVLAGKMLESMSGHVSRCWQCFRISRFQRFTTVSGFML